MILCLISRRAAEASCTPFFERPGRFSHDAHGRKVCLPEPEFMKEFVGSPE